MSEFNFGAKSQSALSNVHPVLERVARRALAFGVLDFSVLSGYRTEEEQLALVAKGASLTVKSAHRQEPALAIDIAPWPVDWHDFRAFQQLAGLMKAAFALDEQSDKWVFITGADWDNFRDLGHFEIRHKEAQ